MQISAYESLKSSGSAWLGDIPTHWGTKKLKFLATVQPSNVDKKTVEGEEPVILCNYTDVYKNEYIDGRLEFMQASATEAEIKKFKVDIGDVIVTKDSEMPDDIAVPACIAEEVEGLVCGYHLTQIKPINLHGPYLFRLFQSRGFNAQFVVSANGVTRFGLPQHAIANAFTPIPPLDEQQTIARFLDFKTAQIDALIAKKKALLDKLAEKRTALISHAVTKGLDPSVAMKDSGVVWLGNVPAHWKVIPIKFSLDMPITDGPHSTPQFYDDGIPFISAEAVKNDRLDFSRMRGYISEDDHVIFSKKYKPKYGDVYMVKSGATTGAVARVETHEDFNIWSPLAVLRPHTEKSITDFLFYVLKSKPFFYSVELSWSYGTQQNIGMGVISNIRMALPPIDEQKEICRYLEPLLQKIEDQRAMVDSVVDRLQEYRSALITNAVTGKIDVRGFEAPQHAEGIAS